MSETAPELERAQWMGVLAKANGAELAARIDALGGLPDYTRLRAPEPGSVMVRARAGGDGEAFHLGEVTVTRCAVRLSDGRVGHAYVQGRNAVHAEHAAVVDAVLQDPERRARWLRDVIAPLRDLHTQRKSLRAQQAASTRVDFFTLARGENR